MANYDPESRSSREALAVALLSKLHEWGFSLEKRPNTDEAVYSRVVHGTDDRVRVMVYTTVVNGRVPYVRACGRDAIRVCAVYASRRDSLGDRGLIRETRVNRTGEIEKIVGRVHTRSRSVYKQAMSPTCCTRCGSPSFKSKSGNTVCADLCWKSDHALAREALGFAPRGDGGPPSRYRRKWRMGA